MIKKLQEQGLATLREQDPTLYELIERESRQQGKVLTMVAASSYADPSVWVSEGNALINVTTEGYPGARYHGGCAVVDEIETLAIERAKARFGAKYANVQPHSGSSANAIVMFSLLKPGDVILGMTLDAGGHLTHGSRASVMGNYFEAIGYGTGRDGLIDFADVSHLAEKHRPKLIICGASSYPRTIDFAAFRRIADNVGAYLLADISHIAGLVVAGLHPSPIDDAHFTTTSTYKQLYGPRGGLVLIGREFETLAPNGQMTLAQMIQQGCFPFLQGTPNLAAVAAKACALERIAGADFRACMQLVVDGAEALGHWFSQQGYSVLTGGTDNHMVVMNILDQGLTGVIAQRALEECGIIVNKNRIPGDQKSAVVTSGLRLGTNSLAVRGLGAAHMPRCARLIHRVLESVVVESDRAYSLPVGLREEVLQEVQDICSRYPLVGHTTEPT